MCQHETMTLEDSVTRTLAAADTLRACGQAITKESLERELRKTSASAPAAPDPYLEPLKQLRAAQLRPAERSVPAAITLPSDGSAPNPYDSVLKWGKR